MGVEHNDYSSDSEPEDTVQESPDDADVPPHLRQFYVHAYIDSDDEYYESSPPHSEDEDSGNYNTDSDATWEYPLSPTPESPESPRPEYDDGRLQIEPGSPRMYPEHSEE